MLSITKIAFTIVVVAVVVLLVRTRSRPAVPPANRPAPMRSRSSAGRRRALVWLLAYGVLALMLFSGALFLYGRWQDDAGVVAIRVINTNTGRSVSYRAHRGDVEGRRFQTLDGRMVTLAEVERMELDDDGG